MYCRLFCIVNCQILKINGISRDKICPSKFKILMFNHLPGSCTHCSYCMYNLYIHRWPEQAYRPPTFFTTKNFLNLVSFTSIFGLQINRLWLLEWNYLLCDLYWMLAESDQGRLVRKAAGSKNLVTLSLTEGSHSVSYIAGSGYIELPIVWTVMFAIQSVAQHEKRGVYSIAIYFPFLQGCI